MTYSDSVRFEWDPAKNVSNLRKHGVSFEEVASLFTLDEPYLELWDEDHSGEEERFIGVGAIASGVVYVVYTERGEDVIRIISARAASRAEVAWFWDWRSQ